jgi:hypothetical protein
VEASEAPLAMSYARYLIRRDDSYDSGMSLGCSGRTGGVFSRDGDDLGEIQDGDSLDTLLRMADEHRPFCEWAISPGDEREHPELTVQKRAVVYLESYVAGELWRFAELHRLDYNVWDAWTRREGPHVDPVRAVRNGVGYEMALMAVFRAMGDSLPEGFQVRYLYQPMPRPSGL